MKKTALLSFLALSLLSLSLVAQTKAPMGIDVSKYQGTIDWPKVATDNNLEYVYVKATEGATITDERFETNVREARKVGLPVGCYMVYSRHTNAQSQFDNFQQTVKGCGMTLVPVIDIEPEPNFPLNIKRVDMLLQLFEEYYGVKPIIYTTMEAYKKYFNLERYASYHVFIACYDLKFPATRYTLWQYTSREKVEGILADVDGIKMHPTYTLDDITLPKTKKNKK